MAVPQKRHESKVDMGPKILNGPYNFLQRGPRGQMSQSSFGHGQVRTQEAFVIFTFLALEEQMSDPSSRRTYLQESDNTQKFRGATFVTSI